MAKVNGDDALLAKSRLPLLERALSRELIPAKREIVGAATQAEVRAIGFGIRTILNGRKNGIAEQLAELKTLRGKNDDVINHMMDRIRAEKDSFDRSLQRFTALRTVFAQQTNQLVTVLGMDVFRNNAVQTRKHIQESPFTKGVRAAMTAFFTSIYEGLDQSAHRTAEIHDMMQAMYRRFAGEHGLEPYNPPPFSMLKYQKEVQRLERAYSVHFNTLWNMGSTEKSTLQRKFFETIASRIKHVYHIANRDVESWLKAVMAPLETQVREHQMQLRRRLDSIKRIHRASDELEERIEELEHAENLINAQLRALETQLLAVEIIVEAPDSLPMAANS